VFVCARKALREKLVYLIKEKVARPMLGACAKTDSQMRNRFVARQLDIDVLIISLHRQGSGVAVAVVVLSATFTT